MLIANFETSKALFVLLFELLLLLSLENNFKNDLFINHYLNNLILAILNLIKSCSLIKQKNQFQNNKHKEVLAI